MKGIEKLLSETAGLLGIPVETLPGEFFFFEEGYCKCVFSGRGDGREPLRGGGGILCSQYVRCLVMQNAMESLIGLYQWMLQGWGRFSISTGNARLGDWCSCRGLTSYDRKKISHEEVQQNSVQQMGEEGDDDYDPANL